MKKSKIILCFSLLFLTYLTFTALTLDTKAETYSIPEGTEFTLTMISPEEGTVSISVTSNTGTAVTGKISSSSGLSCQTQENQDLTGYIYGRDFIDSQLSVVSTLKNVTYAGKTVEAWTTSTLGSGIDYVAVVNSTGVILNITSTQGTFYLSSWEYEECAAIPGYEIPLVLAMIGLLSLGIIIYIHKKR